MSSNNDETSNVIYITTQALNSSVTNSNATQCIINQSSNSILPDSLDQYNVYVNSITLTTSDLPYFNAQRNIAWDPTNFTTNKMNCSIGFISTDGSYIFDNVPQNNSLVKPIGNPDVNGHYQAVCVFLQYISENTFGGYLNPNQAGYTTSSNYPRSYFNVHSVSQFLGFINTAINTALACSSTYTNQQNNMYFTYNSNNQIYSLVMPDTLYSASMDFYVNGFLERYLDAFRWNHVNIAPDITLATYGGREYVLVKNLTPNCVQI
jgi:hypothetical protein